MDKLLGWLRLRSVRSAGGGPPCRRYGEEARRNHQPSESPPDVNAAALAAATPKRNPTYLHESYQTIDLVGFVGGLALFEGIIFASHTVPRIDLRATFAGGSSSPMIRA